MRALLLGFLLFGGVVLGEEPSDIFLDVFCKYQKAERIRTEAPRRALAIFLEANEKLTELACIYPDWEREIVAYRTSRIAAALQSLHLGNKALTADYSAESDNDSDEIDVPIRTEFSERIGHATVARELTLRMEEPINKEMGFELIRIAEDGTTTIRVEETGALLTAKVGTCFESKEFGREGLRLIDASATAKKVTIVRTMCIPVTFD